MLLPQALTMPSHMPISHTDKDPIVEISLRDNWKLLQVFVDHAPAAMAMYDSEMRLLAFSKRWLETYGVNDADIVGRSHYELIPGTPAQWRDEHRRALDGEEVEIHEERFERSDGDRRWLRRELLPWRQENGEIGGIVILTEDISRAREAETALRQSREHLRLFVEHAPAALAMFDSEMCYLAASQRWLQDYGIKGRYVIGLSHYEIFPETPERWKEIHRRCLAGEAILCREDRFERKNGTVQWLRWEARPWRLQDGSVGGIAIFSEDITRNKRDQERLQLAANVFRNASESIMITALDGAILDVNDAFSRVTGYSREEVLGHNPRILNSGRQSAEFYDEMWRAIRETGHWRGEFWNRRKNGELFASATTISTVCDEEGNPQHLAALFSDITPMKEQERRLEQIAHYDALTGLANRALLGERLRAAMQETAPGRMLAVAYFDLDAFKAVNDRHGREVGDALLAALAERMKESVPEDGTLARLAGDEFVTVLRNLESADAALPTLTRLLASVADPVQLGDLVVQVSASAGMALYPQSEEVDADQLLRQPDRAMCQAKLGGSCRFHIFDPKQDRSVRTHLDDVEQIRKALAQRQFVLFYQPKVNMALGRVIGAEALIRWQHPERGLLSPAMFLPVIEHDPLAIEMGDWVIDSALSQMERWRESGFDVPVSVNLFARQLQEPGFVDRLRTLLAAHPRVDAANLELEVLETSALLDLAQISRLIGECRRVGVSVALDDFGTGYSSLTYLKRLPANILKIDQSFIRDMLSDPEDLAILEGVLGLANAFQRQAIAEGVESVEHGTMLLQLGCDLAQGYGIARPMPAADLPAWAAAWKPDPRWAETEALSPADWPALYAGVEHRAWLRSLEEFLKGERTAPPAIGAERCRLGSWLLTERDGVRGARSEFKSIEALHRRIHETAAHAVAAKNKGRGVDVQMLVGELCPLLEEMVEGVKALIRRT